MKSKSDNLPYNNTIKDLYSNFASSEDGLSSKQAALRIEEYGLNKITGGKKISPVKIFIRQFTSFVVLILIAAMIISILIGEKLDAVVIAAIVVLNGTFGFVQEFRAEKAIEALKKMAALKAKVIRDGKHVEIDAENVVPGDILYLETGDKVAADARLFRTASLEIEESSLTGESVPSEKDEKLIKGTVPLGDRSNMVFMGTVVTKGNGYAVVTGTGMKTEMGHIAKVVEESGDKVTPLQHKLAGFSRMLGYITIGVCIAIFLIGIGKEYLFAKTLDLAFVTEMFLAAVALAVAAIPEGLPAIVTMTLALGVQRMVRRNALIRKLPSVETLGSTSIICTDKTGTLTQNAMTVKEVYANNKSITVSGRGYFDKGGFDCSGKDIKNMDLLLRIGLLCNNTVFDGKEVSGDPTEAALLVSARKAGLRKEKLEKAEKRIDEIPFDSDRKLMTTIHKIKTKNIAYVKGAPDKLIDRCTHFYVDGKIKKLTWKEKNRILKANTSMAERALRVLGFAYKELPSKYKKSNIEHGLVFVGFQAMIDPPRSSVVDSIKKCKDAGIRVVMITGDHKITAQAIAEQVGIFEEDDLALSGTELDEISDAKLYKICSKVSVYARVSPDHKARILQALQKNGNIVAMTGDGVNDAPALKKADIGISMGVAGTEVAKEASDMILTDDNFSSIVNAVEEGRGIFDSIKMFVQYTLSSNLGEILVILMAILIGWPLPLVAVQILWVNLVTDGLPGLALGLDPFQPGLMKRPPKKKTEGIITKEVVSNIIIVGAVMCIGTLFMYYRYGIGTDLGRTMAFTTLIMFQLFNVLTYRAKNFLINIPKSLFLIGSFIISVLMQFIVLYTPLNKAFGVIPLNFHQWLTVIGVTISIYIILELRKMIFRIEI